MKSVAGLTVRQERVLSFLKEYARRRGYPPTIREIRTAFGLRSNRGVVDHLRALERKGYIRRTRGISRAIEIVECEGNVGRDESTVRALPIAGRVAAGWPEPPCAESDGSLLLDKKLFEGDGDFILEVRGESMTGEHIVPGDLVVVKKTSECETGSLVVAIVDGETTIKRFTRRGKKALLEPANPAYEPIELTEAHGREAAIIGAVVGVIRRVPARRRAFSG